MTSKTLNLPTPLNFLLWNINGGGGSRGGAIREAVAGRSPTPEVVVLNEHHPGRSDRLIDELRAAGWSHVASSAPPAGFGGVALLSRKPLMVSGLPEALAPFGHRCVRTEIPGSDVVVWGVYAPYGGADVPAFWSALQDALVADADRPTIVLGDLNAGVSGVDTPDDSLPGNRHVERLTSLGYEDLWRCGHAEDAAEWSWHGRANPYRIDHAFGSAAAVERLGSCEYSHGEREAGTSDHSILTLELLPRPLASKGSQRWLQLAVNRHTTTIDPQILGALGAQSGATVEWLSPLASEGYVEYRDGATIDRLGVTLPEGALKAFWPNGGPMWDGLARVGDAVLLVEAKAHIPEMLSGGTRASGAAFDKIARRLAEVRGAIAPRTARDWNGDFYQYANRLAHLHFLREHGVQAHLVYVNFLNATDVDGPATRERWEGATQLMEACLGLSRRHRLVPFVHKVYLDVRELTDSSPGAAGGAYPAAASAIPAPMVEG